MKKLLLLLFVGALIMTSCSKDKDELPQPSNPSETEVGYGNFNVQIDNLVNTNRVHECCIRIFKNDGSHELKGESYYSDQYGRIKATLPEGNYVLQIPFRCGYNYVCYRDHNYKLKANETIEIKDEVEVKTDTLGKWQKRHPNKKNGEQWINTPSSPFFLCKNNSRHLWPAINNLFYINAA